LITVKTQYFLIINVACAPYGIFKNLFKKRKPTFSTPGSIAPRVIWQGVGLLVFLCAVFVWLRLILKPALS
jgi:hypothetical protein